MLLLNAVAVSPELLERDQKFATVNLDVPVRILNIQAVTGTNMDEQVTQLLRFKTPNDVAVVALIAITNAQMHTAVLSSRQVALVNVSTLIATNQEVFAKRVIRQTMRGAGALFGLEPSPDPFCVMHDYETLEQLDKMGLNFGPPWQMLFKKEAHKRGLTVLSEQE